MTNSFQNRIFIWLCFSVMILLCCSCKKQELDWYLPERLIGKWEWTHSEQTVSIVPKIYTPETENIEIELEFKREGYFHLNINGECERRHRIKQVDVVNEGISNLYRIDLSRKNGYGNFSLFMNEDEIYENIKSNQEYAFFGLDLPDPDGLASELHHFIKK